MKKSIILAVAISAVATFSALAQNKNVCPKQNCNNTCQVQTCDRQAGQDRMRRPATWREFAFEGILLDIDQQAKIDKINQEFDSKCKDKGQKGQCADCTGTACPNNKGAKAACNGDSCKHGTCDRAHCHNRHNKGQANNRERIANRINLRKEYLAQVKQVLTPEQYTTLLENIVNMPQQGNRDGNRRFDRKRHGHGDCRFDSCMAKDKACMARDAKRAGNCVKKDAKKVADCAKKDAKKVESKLK